MAERMPRATGSLPVDWADRTASFWALDAPAAAAAVGSTTGGLGAAEAATRLAAVGPNASSREHRASDVTLLVRQFASPIVLILVFATIISGLLGDVTDAEIILAIIVVSGLLGFWQERGASHAVAELLALVRVEASAVRGGAVVPTPILDIVPGDVVQLAAGAVVPGDALVLAATTAQVDESALTGESFPVEKQPGVLPADTPLAKRVNSLFLGTHVVSGTLTALVMRTGPRTEFGRVSAALTDRSPTTSFEQGLTAFGFLLLRAVIVPVVAIFAINVVLARPLVDAALFSLALAVGLTPQLLPAIVTISLSQGARAMARQRVIVKRLDAIEDFGSMSILCTDKTGTLTVGAVSLAGTLASDGSDSPLVRRLAFFNAKLQHGFDNPIDTAIIAAASPAEAASAPATALAEVPYDFTRRRLTVLVRDGPTHRLITKGALADVLAASTTARAPGVGAVDLATVRSQIDARFAALSADGQRVLGVASRDLGAAVTCAAADEQGLTFEGFVTFVDPPKPGIADTLRDLAASGVSVRMVTGDNRLVAAHVGAAAGLSTATVLTGPDVDALTGEALAAAARSTAVFAEIAPAQKERIIRALRASGESVGYLGDGINDAPALHAADVGISVDTGVDVAKEAAAIVLLDKDLRVLLDGVRQGRRTFANTMKYVYTTTSASFGNVLSMAVASAVLPFLPLLADQILLLNFLTDLPATTIATDAVDPELLDRPRRWDIHYVRNFMIVFGLVSSGFDLLTFATLLIVFHADAMLFRSGWFVESAATELAVLFVLRTRRVFFRSRPSTVLVLSSVAIALVTVAIPYTPLAGPLGIDDLPAPLLASLVAITAAYVLLTETVKQAFNGWADRHVHRLATVPTV
jgi:Mg2+-importing ATPase